MKVIDPSGKEVDRNKIGYRSTSSPSEQIEMVPHSTDGLMTFMISVVAPIEMDAMSPTFFPYPHGLRLLGQ